MTVQHESEKKYTAKQASEMLDCSKKTVHNICNKHKIGTRLGDSTMRAPFMLTLEDIELVKTHLGDTKPVQRARRGRKIA